MASIQQGINQLIATAALGAGVYTRSAAGKARSEEREGARFADAASGYKKMIADPNTFTGTDAEQILKREGAQKLYKQARDSAVNSRLRAVNLKPTQDRVDSYLGIYAEQQAELREERAQSASTKAAIKAREAMQRMRQLGQQQIAQNKTRRNFMDYLRKETSSLGKVGDLPESVQKEIAKKYSAAERKKLMDNIDANKKGANNGRKV